MSETEKLAVRGCSIIEKDSGQIVAVGCRGYDREELERLCLCVNSHDALLAACEDFANTAAPIMAAQILEKDDDEAKGIAVVLRSLAKQAKAAIAAAGEK